MKTRNFFKTLLLLVLLVVAGGFGQQAKAQYQSFFGDSITTYNLAGECVSYDPFALGGSFMYYPTVNRADTVRIDGKLYYRSDYNCGWDEPPSCIREDTTTGQIFRYYSHNGYSAEICVCDMSLSVGDTFRVAWDPWCSNTIVADSITYMNGKKVIHFRRIGYAEYAEIYYCDIVTDYGDLVSFDLPIMFIEGIGPTYGPLGPDPWSWRGCVLLCMYKDGEFVFALDEENLGCEQEPLAKVEENQDLEWTVFPNPCHRYLNIRFDEKVQSNGLLYVTNMAGCVVFSQKVCNREVRIDVRALSAGIYTVTYMSAGTKKSKKIVKR